MPIPYLTPEESSLRAWQRVKELEAEIERLKAKLKCKDCETAELLASDAEDKLEKEVSAHAATRRAGLQTVATLEAQLEELRQSHLKVEEANRNLKARLARCVEAGNHLRGFAAGTDLGKAYIEDWDAAAKGGE